MRLEIDTSEELTSNDKQILETLTGSRLRIAELQNELGEKEKRIRELVKKLESVQKEVQLKTQGIAPAVRQLFLNNPDDSFTVLEICEQLGLDPSDSSKTTSIYSAMNRWGKLDSSTGRPKRYFLRDKGDPDLKEALKDSKVNMMG